MLWMIWLGFYLKPNFNTVHLTPSFFAYSQTYFQQLSLLFPTQGYFFFYWVTASNIETCWITTHLTEKTFLDPTFPCSYCSLCGKSPWTRLLSPLLPIPFLIIFHSQNCSLKTAFINISSDLHMIKSNGQFSVFILFNLLAAFYTIAYFLLQMRSLLGFWGITLISPHWLLHLSIFSLSSLFSQACPLECPRNHSFTDFSRIIALNFIYIFHPQIHISSLDFAPWRPDSYPAAYSVSTWLSNRHLKVNGCQNEQKILPLLKNFSYYYLLNLLSCSDKNPWSHPWLLSPRTTSDNFWNSFFKICPNSDHFLTPPLLLSLPSCHYLSLLIAKIP